VLRQRVRLRRSPLELAGRLVLMLFALILVWYGAMLVLLALGVDPSAVNAISGYRDAFDELTAVDEADVTDGVRLVAGLGGLAAFLVFGYLALRHLPRPYLARSDLRLAEEDQGVTDVNPRAVERVAEVAAGDNPAVTSARGRLEDEKLVLELRARRARELADTLRDAQRRALTALERHQLPVRTVDVVLIGFERTTRRELE
jgi:hypothetical protein